MKHELKETLVQIKDISLSFDGFKVLGSVNSEVKNITREGRTQGQVIGLLGPSGVGKTQFSRILSGLQKPDSGHILINVKNEMILTQSGMVGFVEQNYPLFQWRTVMGNLLVALEHSGLSKDEKRSKAIQMLEEFGLASKAKTYPSQLSGGQRQRIAIIRELLSSEHYLVLDEPFTGLDPLMKDVLCDLIDHVANLNESNTIFVVAHDIPALVQISDTLWLFGRDKDEKGNFVPGAYIKRSYDLISSGLAWRKGIETTQKFSNFCMEIKEEFREL